MMWRERLDKVACTIFRVLQLSTRRRFRQGRWEIYKIKGEELPLMLLTITIWALAMLILGISYRSWGFLLVAALVIPEAVILDVAYALWWFQEGRYGMECPWLDADITQNENLTSVPSETELRRMDPPDVRKDTFNRL